MMFWSTIPPDTDSGLKAALKSRIHYGNEYSLTKRFKLIFRELDEELVKLVTDDPTAFSRAVVDTRNYLVHRDPALEALAFNNEGMFYASHRLKILLTILLLQSLGLSDDSIRDTIAENRRYQPFDA